MNTARPPGGCDPWPLHKALFRFQPQKADSLLLVIRAVQEPFSLAAATPVACTQALLSSAAQPYTACRAEYPTTLRLANLGLIVAGIAGLKLVR